MSPTWGRANAKFETPDRARPLMLPPRHAGIRLLLVVDTTPRIRRAYAADERDRSQGGEHGNLRQIGGLR